MQHIRLIVLVEPEPIRFTAIFPAPGLKLPPVVMTHRFEIIELNKQEYEFIIGVDLIPILFPTGIPLAFIPASPTPAVAVPGIKATASVKAGCSEAAVRSSTDSEATNPTGRGEATGTAQAGASDVQLNAIALSNAIDELAGEGYIPPNEMPARIQFSTAAEKEEYYSSNRARLEADPEIIKAREINSQIEGFCNLPEAVVHLDVDPEKEHTLYRKQYKVPHTLHQPVTDCVNRWLAEGKIKQAPPGCEYNNPLTVAPKRDDQGNMTGTRICLDTRALNAALRKQDRFQLPHIRDALEQLGGNTIFGEFDLSEAYLQFPMAEESQKYTAFTWNGIQYVFLGAPFGLSPLPSHFQRTVSVSFGDLECMFEYLDNFPFGSKDWESHRDHILAIIHRCNQLNLRIKPSSVKFGYSEIRCLGHRLSGMGISIDGDKLKELNAWPVPKTGEQLQSFLGFATYLRDHVRHFADLTAPLEAIKNEKELVWTDLLLEHFHMTKDALSRAPLLRFPDFSRPFHLATDASMTGVGGVLYQPDSDDNDDITATNIVAIFSKKLTPCQQRYPAYKLELLALVYALRKSHCWVWGRQDLVLHTDHKPLTHMFQSPELSHALQQWLDVILEYQFEIRYRPGVLNVMPDALSRMYAAEYEAGVWGVPSSIRKITGAPVESGDQEDVTISMADVDVSQAGGDAPSSSLVGEGNANASNTDADPADTEAEADAESESKKQQIALLWDLEMRAKTCPLSQVEKQKLIEQAHLFGHFGREAVFKGLWDKGHWWPKIREDIQQVLANCDACNRYTVTKAGYNPAQFIMADQPVPWWHLMLDTSVHMPASKDGYTALLVIIDVFTGFIILRPVLSTGADMVARELWDLFCTFGLPKTIQSDNGPEFVNEVIRILVQLTGIDHRFISPYNPRADGKVERSIGTVMSIIKKMLHGTDKDWPLFVPFAQLSFNHKIAALTGSSPFSLMFGRAFNDVKDYTGLPAGAEPTQIDIDNWKAHQEKILSVIYPALEARIHVSKQAMITRLNKHRRVLMAGAIPNGAVVMLIDKNRLNKFEPKYVGPYYVIRRARNGAYVLRDTSGDMLDRHVPADQLKLVSRKPRPVDVENQTWEVQEILEHRGEPGRYEYRVKWKDYNDRTWEPASSFLDTMVIKNYWKHHKAQAASGANSQ